MIALDYVTSYIVILIDATPYSPLLAKIKNKVKKENAVSFELYKVYWGTMAWTKYGGMRWQRKALELKGNGKRWIYINVPMFQKCCFLLFPLIFLGILFRSWKIFQQKLYLIFWETENWYQIECWYRSFYFPGFPYKESKVI